MDLNNVDSQMKLFQEGGIADDGIDRDPVSGNEVPPGSLASEVRDDVDAKLSEGEYVVPADVVRFFGVDYFEKLRKKAKAGLEDMEADGRIGGEPMPEGLGGEDDFPFSNEELMSFEDEEPIEMAEGGAVASKFNPQAFRPGFSFGMGGTGGGSATGGVVTKTYRNAAGEVRSIMFVNGQPIQTIPTGFYEDTPENRAKFATPETSAPSASVASVSTGGPDGPGDEAAQSTGDGGSRGRGFDVNDPLGAAQAALEGRTSGIVGGVLGTVAGSLIGQPALGGRLGKGVGEANAVANAAANAEIASILGYNTTAIDKAIEEASKGKLTSSMVDRARENAREDAFNINAAKEDALTRDKFQTPEAFSSAMQSVAPSGMDFNPDTGSYSRSGSAAPTTSLTPPSMPASIASQRSGSSGGGDFGGVGTAPGNYSGPNPDGSAGFTVGDSGGGGGDGGTVICTALNSLGLLPDDVYKLDQEFGRLADLHDPALTRGYRRWATPVAEYIKKNTLLSKVARYAIKPLANAWANEMAHQMDPANYRGNLVGKFLMLVGHPICRKLGKE
jgi:hypothetical protein